MSTKITAALLFALFMGCGGTEPVAKTNGNTRKFSMSDQEWRERLTSEQYRVARGKGTERAFSGKYWNTKTPGTYRCVCCGQALFSSETKYDSDSGWPSFYAPADGEAVDTEVDTSLGSPREEVLCSRCGTHLGHVFPDGPEPTGLRYCVNSASLQLEPEAE